MTAHRHDFPELPLAPPPPNRAASGEGQPTRLTASELRILPSDEPTYGVLDEVLAARRAHFARGHTPASDTAHGEMFFLNGASHFLAQARHARSPEKMRKHRIAAIAMLVALIDRDDFLARSTEGGTDADAQ